MAKSIARTRAGRRCPWAAQNILDVGMEPFDLGGGPPSSRAPRAASARPRRRCSSVRVNNAGIAVRKTAFGITLEEWERVLGVNLAGLFLCSRVAARSMRNAGGGAIVNLASI
ncbi:MAG: SDR family NAD(P)-dependent oxidoreductase [Betaproteobacteria bacterium]|nr:MAG: SDR family NAD(P)-dependent oxidoreductase [Betaproteobacteria bacterium]